MDKAHLNDFITKKRFIVKLAIKRMDFKVKKNRKKLDELAGKVQIEKKANKIKSQIERCKEEEKLIKSISADEITKLALVISNCKDLLNSNELNAEEKLKIRTVDTNIVQKMVGEFKGEFPESEQWIDVTIDLLDVKKIMKSYKDKNLTRQLEKQLTQRRNILKVYRARNKIEQDQNELRDQSELEIQRVMKRIKLSDFSEKSSDNIDNLVDLVTKEKVGESVLDEQVSASRKNKKDNRITDIIKSKLDVVDESDDESNDESDEPQQNESEPEMHPEDDDELDESAGESDKESDEINENPGDSEMNETSSTEQIEHSECDEEANYESSYEDNCSIDSSQWDKFVDETAQQEYLNNRPDSGNEKDILIEDCEYESSAEEEEEENEQDTNEVQENEPEATKESDNESSTVDLQSGSNVVDVEKAGEDYLKKQLVKAFGEKIANRTPKDVQSDEEWEDDFFINKKVKKFKPTVVDLERYKDLEEKEKGAQAKEDESNERDEEAEETKQAKSFKSKKFKKKFVKKFK